MIKKLDGWVRRDAAPQSQTDSEEPFASPKVFRTQARPRKPRRPNLKVDNPYSALGWGALSGFAVSLAFAGLGVISFTNLFFFLAGSWLTYAICIHRLAGVLQQVALERANALCQRKTEEETDEDTTFDEAGSQVNRVQGRTLEDGALKKVSPQPKHK